ncbi:MAG: lactate permease [Sulfurimonas sp. RIFCSPHIGHO2_12_FULL_36_9]|uniref:lactate permease n=1 Tax=Sulfurimonas sp. RIFCSPLOWO2_12_36_12 TaxID=1802253 RepID=UPI0008B39BD6|nr:lactate permease [Sulfurimonas sp. RIFCSPLOWO2_12_36_12]OHD96451.1 MAG: lactate permease [Sulfurimonas sp. RIFCSPHIGHO2_12_FULL_36_9]OHD99567.1 MAG: lactate permease [Sulfurimonas sp. RIFCSPLOWO2_02_FULL_36_28]OHE02402.1 MAG: lactate permease [Sulfurimonas sp. RIFCSPLOWO2_12_36_12]OHE07659.1 MAG: lactate permease [Sulfurimonas sp. RIFCSPLOWO2_12_FULL_36_74]
MSSVARFKQRKQMVSKMKNTITVGSDVNQDMVNQFLSSKVNTDLLTQTNQIMETHYEFEYDLHVSPEEAKEFLNKFKNDFNQARFDKLINDCKKDVINSIVTPFGLGKVVAACDKVGGNVNTVHNVRSGIYTTDEERENYEKRDDYISKEYHDNNSNYSDARNTNSILKGEGKLVDGYTGKVFDENIKDQVEHIIAAKEIHDDAGRLLADLDGSELANAYTNLTATSQSVNGSKQDSTAINFLKRVDINKEKIKNLEDKETLTPEEEKGLTRLKRVTKVDEKKVKELDTEARNTYNKKINKKYYTSGKFAKNTAKTSATEGAKMGMQQAIGLVMTEFFTALFDEILDIYKNGFSSGFDDEKFFSVLKERLHNIAEKLIVKWKEVAIAFKDGFISGFISNLVTTVINMFVTTGKRLVRIIREGMFSLFRAIKLLLFPPENMTTEDAMHEAKKLIATGLIVSLGVMIEESVAAFIKTIPIMMPFSDTLSAIFVGAITGLAITMTVYHIDKNKNDKDAIKLLITQTDATLENCEKLLERLQPMKILAN